MTIHMPCSRCEYLADRLEATRYELSLARKVADHARIELNETYMRHNELIDFAMKIKQRHDDQLTLDI